MITYKTKYPTSIFLIEGKLKRPRAGSCLMSSFKVFFRYKKSHWIKKNHTSRYPDEPPPPHIMSITKSYQDEIFFKYINIYIYTYICKQT